MSRVRPMKGQKALSPIFLDKDRQRVNVEVRRRRRTGRRLVFGWYGGKFSHLEWLLPLLPDCHHYCEPFAGSAAVLINREPSPVETYNDIDGAVVNFFRVLRNSPDELIRLISLTPFSREEFFESLDGLGQLGLDWHRRRRWAVGRTASRQAVMACQESCRAGLEAWNRSKPLQQDCSAFRLKIALQMMSLGCTTMSIPCSTAIPPTSTKRGAIPKRMDSN